MISLCGLDFEAMTLDQAAARIAARPAGSPFAYVVTPNADHLARLDRDPALRQVYRNAMLCLLDSRAVAIISRILGVPAPSVVTGSDLTAYLLAHHVHPDERITIIGLDPRWLSAVPVRARPAHHNPPPGFEHDPDAIAATVSFIAAHPARLIFLAVGSPRQERLAAVLAADPTITGTALCIGASLEFLCGARRRAPRLLQRLGLEWLFRLAADPRRLARRYLIDSPRIIGVLWRQRRSGSAHHL